MTQIPWDLHKCGMWCHMTTAAHSEHFRNVLFKCKASLQISNENCEMIWWFDVQPNLTMMDWAILTPPANIELLYFISSSICFARLEFTLKSILTKISTHSPNDIHQPSACHDRVWIITQNIGHSMVFRKLAWLSQLKVKMKTNAFNELWWRWNKEKKKHKAEGTERKNVEEVSKPTRAYVIWYKNFMGNKLEWMRVKEAQTINKMKCIENWLHKTVICMQKKWHATFCFASFSYVCMFEWQSDSLLIFLFPNGTFLIEIVKWMKLFETRSEWGTNYTAKSLHMEIFPIYKFAVMATVNCTKLNKYIWFQCKRWRKHNSESHFMQI